MSLWPGLVPIRYWLYAYNLDATTYKYSRYRQYSKGFGGIKTTGSSVTVDAVTGLALPPFSVLSVGDILRIRYRSATGVAPTKFVRKVATKASDSQITVDTAIDLSNETASWAFQKLDIGAAATDGWIYVGDLDQKSVVLDIAALGEADGVDFTIEGMGGDALSLNPVIVVGPLQIVEAQEPYQRVFEIVEKLGWLRVGVKAHTAHTGTDSITCYLGGRAVR